MRWGISLPIDASDRAADLLKDFPWVRHVQLKLPASPAERIDDFFARVDALRGEIDISLSFHAYPLINFCESVDAVRAVWHTQALEAMDLAARCGGDFVVFHGGYQQTRQFPSRRRAALTLLTQSLTHLLDESADDGLGIQLENIYPAPLRSELIRLMDRAEDYAFLIPRIENPRFSFCFDYGHAMIDDRGFLIQDLVMSRVGSLHLHENNHLEDTHHPIGGAVSPYNWPRELARLRKRAFNGPVIFENPPDQLFAALEFAAHFVNESLDLPHLPSRVD